MKTTIRQHAATAIAALGDQLRDNARTAETSAMEHLGELLVGVAYCIDEDGAASA